MPDQILPRLVSTRDCLRAGLCEGACAPRRDLREPRSNQADAEALLLPALSSRDPEVRWRLADVLIAQERFDEAKTQLDAARFGFDELLGRHLLAFADHAAEFYAGSGNDRRRALELARANTTNRPTRRAVKQAHAIAVSTGEAAAAGGLREVR